MKITTILAVSGIVVSLFATGCNSFSLSPGGSGEKMDIQKRAILSATVASKVRVCAEPSPDAMSSMAMEAAAKGGVPSKVSVELAAALQQSAAFVGLRTTSIQLLRDFGYRLCEAYLSEAIDPGQYDLLMRRFQKNVVALLAIEQLTGAVKAPPVVLTSRGNAEASQSLFDQQAVREKVSEKIAELEKENQKKKDEKAALLKTNAQADTTELTAQITAKEDEINRRKDDLKAIDKGIENARGTLAGGETQPTIQAGSSSTPLSDEAVKVVAAAVENIAMAIVKSDDLVQLCLMTIRGAIASPDTTKKEFAAWCQKEIESDQAGRIYLASLNKKISNYKKIVADKNSTPEQKRQAEKELVILNNQVKEAEQTLEDRGIYKKISDM